jgi:hypothetical protein
MMRSAKSLVMLTALGAACLSCGCGSKTQPAAAATAAVAAASPYRPTATFQEIMDSVVDPAGDYIWKAVSTTVDAKGIHETRPRTDAEWHQLRQRAIMLVEAANLIAVPGRRVAYGDKTIEEVGPLDVAPIQRRLDTQHDALVGFAGALRDVGLKLVAATDRKDVDAITEHGGTLDEVCEACHKVFWYPDQVAPAAAVK